ncbi:unnamed protein product, partial [marine sediment metagenome]
MKEKIKRIFISYAKEDSGAARKLFEHLQRAGFNPWLDTESILPGQRWRNAIRDAIRNSAYVLAILSNNSVSKRGYVQKELKEALEILDELPDSEIFIIPIRLDPCSPSNERLKDLQWLDLFPSWEKGLSKLFRALGQKFEDIPLHLTSINADVVELKFFEAGSDAPPLSEREYDNSFESSEIRYIYWELDLAGPRSDKRLDFKIRAVWYSPDGEGLLKHDHWAYREPEWTTSQHWKRHDS